MKQAQNQGHIDVSSTGPESTSSSPKTREQVQTAIKTTTAAAVLALSMQVGNVQANDTVQFSDGSTAQLVKRAEGTYELVDGTSQQGTDMITGFIQNKDGTVSLVYGTVQDDLKVYNLKTYESYGEVTEQEKTYLDFLEKQGNTDFKNRLILGKREFLQNGGKLADWQDFVGNNLGMNNPVDNTGIVLGNTPTLLEYVEENISKLTYYDDRDEEILPYGDSFAEVIALAHKIQNLEDAKDKLAAAEDKSKNLDRFIKAYENVLQVAGE